MERNDRLYALIQSPKVPAFIRNMYMNTPGTIQLIFRRLPLILANVTVRVLADRLAGRAHSNFVAIQNKVMGRMPIADGWETTARILCYTITNDITETFNLLDADASIKDNKQLSLGLMLSRYHKVRTYVNPERNTIVVVSNKEISTEQLCRIQGALFALLPNLQHTASIPEHILKMMTTNEDEATDEPFLDAVLAWAKENKFEEKLVAQQYKDVLKGLSRNLVESLIRSVNDTRSDIRNYEESLMVCYKNLEKSRRELFAAEQQDTTMYDELAEYIAKKPQLVDFKYSSNNGGRLYFTIVTPMLFVDESALTKILDRRSSRITRNSPQDKLLRACMKGDKIRLLFKEHMYVGLRDYGVYRGEGNEVYVRSSGMPQPHHMGYQCWGNYRNEITKAFSSNNFIPGVETIFTAAASLNVYDGAVFSSFVTDFRNIVDMDQTAYVFLDTNTGANLTVKQALDIIEPPIVITVADAAPDAVTELIVEDIAPATAEARVDFDLEDILLENI